MKKSCLLWMISLQLLSGAGLSYADGQGTDPDPCTDSDHSVAADYVPRSSLGFSAVAYLFRDDRRGLQIKGVTPDSSADSAGLKIDDLILSINDDPIAYENTLQAVVDLTGLEVGAPLKLEVLRDGEVATVELTTSGMAPGFAEDVLAWVARAEDAYRRSDCVRQTGQVAKTRAAPKADEATGGEAVALSAAEWETLERLRDLLADEGAVRLRFLRQAGTVAGVHSSAPPSFLERFESPARLDFLARMVETMLESKPTELAEADSDLVEVLVRSDPVAGFSLELLPAEGR